jgi:hypothetical protein
MFSNIFTSLKKSSKKVEKKLYLLTEKAYAVSVVRIKQGETKGAVGCLNNF